MDLNQISFSIIKNNKKPFDLWLCAVSIFLQAHSDLSWSEAPINNAIRPVPHGAFYTLCYAQTAPRAPRDANKY
jgi:hypothetical protein